MQSFVHPPSSPLYFCTLQRTLFIPFPRRAALSLCCRRHARAHAQIPFFFLRSFFLRRRTSFLPLTHSPFFLMQTNSTVEMNCSENEDRTAAAAELKHILAFRVPPSHAFTFERLDKKEVNNPAPPRLPRFALPSGTFLMLASSINSILI